MSGYDPSTLQFYADEAPVYTASGAGGVSRHLPAFADLLPPGACILELGCGGGTDAAYLAARGFAVDPTDGVAAIAAKASERLGRAVRVMRFDELDADAAYDAVVASASLLHVPRPALTAILARVHRALRPGGWHLATYKGGGCEGRDRFGRYFNYLSADDAATHYRAAALWAQVEIEEGMGGGYDGVQGPWIKVTARR
ncbi:class I SAM-dependent methyltransferase [Sphingopyxis sp. NJF-3]